MVMTLTPSAETTLRSRYYRRDEEGNITEDWRHLCMRVSGAIGETEEQKQTFYEAMVEGIFIPNTPTLMNAGTPLNQLAACFVLPIGDSMKSIYKAISDTALIQKTGGGTGFSFSALRPRGDIVHATQGVASGPISFLRVFDASTGEIKQGGKRRGANMAVMSASHPDIFEFIECKDRENTAITNFNISIWATDDFMDAVINDRHWALINPRTNEVVREVSARSIFDRAVEKAWETGDPGIIFADTMEKGNPTPWIGKYEATNPCAEQPLLPYEACVLGSIDLSKLVADPEPAAMSVIDRSALERCVRLAVRFLDRCIDVQIYVLPEIEQMHKDGNRKIGLGIMGWADVLSKIGIRYGSDESLELARSTMKLIQEVAHDESQKIGQQEPFPNYIAGTYSPDKSNYFPTDHQYAQRRRNATVTTIAPTGTISIIAGCSSGIEPHFALATRRENVLDGQTLVDFNPVLKKILDNSIPVDDDHKYWNHVSLTKFVEDFGYIPDTAPQSLRDAFPTVRDLTVEDHLQMQKAFQEFTDNGVSKTINLPEEATVEDIRAAYMRAYDLGVKAISVYRDKSKVTQVLNVGTAPKLEKSIPQERHQPRPIVLTGHTERMETGIGALYITINAYEDHPYEVFAQIGRAGSEVAAFTEGLARMVSLALQRGISAHDVAHQLMGIGGAHTNGFGEGKILSVPDAIGKTLDHIAHNDPTGEPSIVIAIDLCPECHQGELRHENGCEHCTACGYSSC